MADNIDDQNNIAGVAKGAELQCLKQSIGQLAESCRGDTLALLALLRTLEEVHVHVRDEFFQPSLPNNRQKLYALLRDIELDGGWPYIPRMRLKRLMANFEEEMDNFLGRSDIKK